MLPSILQSAQKYQQHFIDTLEQLLDSDQLGVFILVLANASNRSQIMQQLKSALQTRFEHITYRLQHASADELARLPVDDAGVFHKLQQRGIEQLEVSLQQYVGPWQLNFNSLRSFRPPRNSQHEISQLHQPFAEQAFHFNKPFLAKEILWQGEIESVNTRLMYNKFPFADYHGILLLDAEQRKPQYLSQQDCEKLRRVQQGLSGLDGLGLAYNSLGAFASINHQHWQFFISEKAYPVELSFWSHNNGAAAYPIPLEVFEHLAQAWPRIEALQLSNQAFNLLLRQDKAYLVVRKNQGTYSQPAWTSGFAWSEVMGNITTSNKDEYTGINADQIEQELARLKNLNGELNAYSQIAR